MATSLILGVGNLLLTDDGAGIHAARVLANRLAGRTDVQVLDAGTLSFTLAPVIESAERLIILDATQLDRPAGAVECLLDAEFDEFLGGARLSVHEVGLRDVIDGIRLSDRLPPERALIGIQPASLDWGMELTRGVAAGVDTAVQMALDLLEFWPARSASGSRAA
jgi:hydrogenase maturation protease